MGRVEEIAVVVLVLTAGCSTVGGIGSDPSSTVTPAPVPVDDQRPIPFPPGVDASGITDLETLTAAHTTALGTHSYTVHERYRKTKTEENGTTVLRENETGYVSNSSVYRGKLTRIRTEPNDSVTTYSHAIYGNASVQMTRAQNGELITREGKATTGRGRYTYVTAYRLAEYLTTNETRAKRVVRNGTSFFRVVGIGSQPRMGRVPEETSQYRVSVLIRPNGLVQELTVSYQTTNSTVSYRFWIDAVGETTVEKPDWATDSD